MAETYKVFPLRPLPGIKKDGTQTEGNFWNDGQWMRFYRGLPRSIPGYRAMTDAFPGPSRGLFVNLNGSGFLDTFSGSSEELNVGQFTTDGFGSGVTDITPTSFPESDNNVWQMDSFYNSAGAGGIAIIAHAAPNLADIGSDIAAPVYYGDITAADPLEPAQDDAMSPADFEVSGGIVCLNPYVIAYGSNGLVAWTDEGDPTVFPVANAANPTSSKIVKGMSIRGGSASPSCLLWSLTSVLQMSFVGGDAVWRFDTLSDQSSILSSSGVVEMDGIYYWPGVDRFLVFNGVLRELPNQMNSDFFYSNLNFTQRQKVFGYKIPRWGEIVWCFPKGDSVECNWMVVYNVRENTWYDSPLPTDGRSAAYFAQSWQYPVMGGALPYPGSNYQLWQHEYGVDEVQGNNVNAIMSMIESSDISILGGGIGAGMPTSPVDRRYTQLVEFEPDFILGSSVLIEVLGRDFAMDDNALLYSTSFTPAATNNRVQIIKQAAYLRWRFTCNSQGGYMIMGQNIFGFRLGDATM